VLKRVAILAFVITTLIAEAPPWREFARGAFSRRRRRERAIVGLLLPRFSTAITTMALSRHDIDVRLVAESRV